MTRARPSQPDRLLIVVSDRAGLTESTRAGERRVRRWVTAANRADAHGNAATFAGDPTSPATFAWAGEASSVSVVIDLVDDARSAAVLDAVRRVRPDAAGLVLSDEIRHAAGDGTLARAGDLRDVIRLDLDEELQRLEAERRVHCLREFAAAADTVPILIHPDPDPDAISSALALRVVLGRQPGALPIVTLRGVTRPENRRMLALLEARITETTSAELRAFPRIITVDSQPSVLGGSAAADAPTVQRAAHRAGGSAPLLAVVDHHPVEAGYAAVFADIRPEYGATATIMTEYLRADGRLRIGTRLATALLFGIKTDTDGLRRGATAADVTAYAFLQEHADLPLLRRFERPSYPPAAARAYGRAIAGVETDGRLAVAFAGVLADDQLHVLSELADFCLGIEGVTWSIAAATVGDELVLALRHLGPGSGAGGLARAIADDGGQGGGHATMGRVTLPAAGIAGWRPEPGREAAALLEWVAERINALAD